MSVPVHGAQRRVQARQQRLLARRAVRESLVSLAGLVGRPARNPAGAELGRLADVVCRWGDGGPYPPVAALVAKVGGRRVFVAADQVDDVGSDQVRLRSARLSSPGARRTFDCKSPVARSPFTQVTSMRPGHRGPCGGTP